MLKTHYHHLPLISQPTFQVDKTRTILVFTTHLQAVHFSQTPNFPDIQRAQMIEVCDFIRFKCKQFPQASVVLLGDFNINARLPLQTATELHYNEMIQLLWHHTETIWKDVHYIHLGKHPITYGDAEVNDKGIEQPRELILTPKSYLLRKQRLDYFFVKDTGDLLVESAKVEEFLVKHPNVTQLSDHYGLSAVIRLTVEGENH